MFVTVDLFHFLMDIPLFTMIVNTMFNAIDTFDVSYAHDYLSGSLVGAYLGCPQVGLTICGEPVPPHLVDFQY